MNPSRVFIDGSDNMYGIGTLNNAVVADLDPGPGVDEHTGPCCWLAKYSLDGAYQWGRSWGFGLVDINSLTIALSGDLYLTGSFEWNLVDFDPGPGDDFFTSAGMIDGFLTKYLPTGEYQWTRIWGSAGDEAGYDIAADSDGNAYITGWFTNKVDFDPGLGVDYYTALGCGDAYLLMVPPDGNW